MLSDCVEYSQETAFLKLQLLSRPVKGEEANASGPFANQSDRLENGVGIRLVGETHWLNGPTVTNGLLVGC